MCNFTCISFLISSPSYLIKMLSSKMLVTSGDSVLTGFGSSSGSSTTDETCEREESLDELARHLTQHMLVDDEFEIVPNKHNAARFQGNTYWRQKGVNEYGDGGMRAAFVPPNGSGMRNRSSGGTGVFIPRAAYTLPNRQYRRRQGRRGSRVLIPERVLDSLKQHHENRNVGQATQADPTASFQDRPEPLNETAATENRNGADNDDELQLPQEWTY